MLTEKGREAYIRENGVEPEKIVLNKRKVKETRFEINNTPDRRDLIRQFQREIYQRNLKLVAPSIGSTPDRNGEKQMDASKIDATLERKFGKMRTGEGWGIAPTESGGIPVLEEGEWLNAD